MSESQFHDAAVAYSNVRQGRGDLTIQPSANASTEEASAYKAGAMNDVAALLQTNTGRAEVEGLSHNDAHHHTTIEPNLDAKTNTATPGAVTLPDDWSKAVPQDDGARGAGSDSQVHYNPGIEARHSRSDVVLSHELMHATDETHGQMDMHVVDAADGDPADLPAPGRDPVAGYDLRAVGLGNQYRDQPVSENSYRRERQVIGAQTPDAALPGDARMPLRDRYRDF